MDGGGRRNKREKGLTEKAEVQGDQKRKVMKMLANYREQFACSGNVIVK